MSDFNLDELKLEPGEGVLLHSYDIWCFNGKDEHSYDDLYLTNKHLIRVTEKTKFLGKPETIVDKIPLIMIREAKQVNDEEYGNSLRICYKDGESELYELCSSPKKEHPKWASAISEELPISTLEEPLSSDVVPPPIIENHIVEEVETNQSDKVPKASINTDKVVAGATAIFAGLKTVVDAAKQSVSEKPKKEVANSKNAIHCSNCGVENNNGAKFCQNCGSAFVETTKSSEPINVHNIVMDQVQADKKKDRQIVYDGELHKCPSCGETINAFTTECPTCGYELRGTNVASSVRELSLKLEQIGYMNTNTKKISLNPFKGVTKDSSNTANDQKVSLIRSFSIPNTKEDIIEFMILASSNIDMKLYGLHDQGVLTADQRELSDAWLAKFEQAYQKAKLMLKGDDFQNIQELYNQTHKKLRFEKLKKPLTIVGPFLFLILIVAFCLIMSSFE